MKKPTTNIWRITWGIIYASVLILNFFYADTWPAKLLACVGIGLNIVYATQHSPRDHLLQIALSFTLLADVILSINNLAFLGVFCFAFVQFFHFARLSDLDPRYFIIFLAAITVIVYLLPLLGLESMFVIGTFYACFLGANLILSTIWYRKKPSRRSRAAMLGFILFILCDTCVAISYFSRVGLLPLPVHYYADFLSWVFYYPSQIFIAQSGKV